MARVLEGIVFSTSVEVFLTYIVPLAGESCLLHVRGGVSRSVRLISSPPPSSPRPWRCFLELELENEIEKVFSTSVEVFLNVIRPI